MHSTHTNNHIAASNIQSLTVRADALISLLNLFYAIEYPAIAPCDTESPTVTDAAITSRDYIASRD